MTNIWRKDITGLRALAVVPVLIFHAFPNLLPGGFYGVDIFFVISGYLISGIIFRGLVSDSFSFFDFYIKRVKRIVPNLLAVLFFVLIVGWYIAIASEFSWIAANVSHSALFYQNFTLMKEGDYFGVSSQNNPLLHIWSLSIEEQFYIIFPFFCFLIWKIGKKSTFCLGVFVVGLTILSFLLCLTISDQVVRFYLPFSRFWELGVGICVAYIEIFSGVTARRYGEGLLNGLSVFGFGLILLAFFLPSSLYSSPPGFFSLIPVVGSALLILSNANSLINRSILSWSWVTFIGLISYSLYLWHWPLLAYVRIFFSEPSDFQLLFALLCSLPISILVYKLIENPFRRLHNNKWCLICLILLLLGSYLSGKIIRKEAGFPDRNIAIAMSFKDDWSYPKGLMKSPYSDDLLVTNNNAIPRIVFVGDSHVEQYHSRIVDQAESRGLTVGFVTQGGCVTSIGVDARNKQCRNSTRALKPILNNKDIRVLVIGQKWGGYSSNLMTAGVSAYADLVEEFIRIDSSRKVYIILDNPWTESGAFDIEKYLESRFNVKEKMLINNYDVVLPEDDDWDNGNKYVLSKFDSKVIYIETASFICPSEKCNLKNFKDNNHLRSSYVRKYATWIDQIFE